MKLECSDSEIIDALCLDGAFGNNDKIKGFWSGNPYFAWDNNAISNGQDMISFTKEGGVMGMFEFTPAGLVIAGMALNREADNQDVIKLMSGRSFDLYTELMRAGSVWYAKSVTESDICLHVEGASASGVFRTEELPHILSNDKIRTVWNVKRAPQVGRKLEVLPIDDWYYPQRDEWIKHNWNRLKDENPNKDYDRYNLSLARLLMEGAVAHMSIDNPHGNLYWDKENEIQLLQMVTGFLFTRMSPETHMDHAPHALSQIKNNYLRSAAEAYIFEL